MHHDPDVFAGITAVISGRAARLLRFWAKFDEIRGKDAELDHALDTLEIAGARWASSDAGTRTPKSAELRSEWVSTKEAADMLQITDRGVRKACEEGRLTADSTSGTWRIHRQAVARFKAQRKSR